MAYCVEKDNYLHLLMEFFESVSLYDLLFDKESVKANSFTVLKKHKIAQQLCRAIIFI